MIGYQKIYGFHALNHQIIEMSYLRLTYRKWKVVQLEQNPQLHMFPLAIFRYIASQSFVRGVFQADGKGSGSCG